MNFRGNRYDSKLTTVEIAKLIRADIKAALSEGKLPAGVKVSVRSSSFSGGSAIDITITEVPEGTVIFNQDFDDHRRNSYTDQVFGWMELLRDIGLQYNRNDSDIMTDYFSVNFYLHARIAWDVKGGAK